MTMIQFKPATREAARELPSLWANWDAFDRLFDLAGSATLPGILRASRGAAEIYSPPVDIHQKGDEIVLRAELPGVKESDIELTIHGDSLTIKGSKKVETEDAAEGKYRYVERRYGEFLRTFGLPTLVDESKSSAAFKDGVLEVRMPVAESAKPRRISINAADNGNGHSANN